jgi:hypothetical protein
VRSRKRMLNNRLGEPGSDHQVDHRSAEHGCARLSQIFIISGESAVATRPSEGPFANQLLREHGDALDAGGPPDFKGPYGHFVSRRCQSQVNQGAAKIDMKSWPMVACHPRKSKYMLPTLKTFLFSGLYQ